MNNVLVIGAHPDDETLGVGGTLLKLKQRGVKLHWMLFTEATAEIGWTQDKIQKREAEIKKVAEIYGFSSLIRLGYPAATLDQIPKSKIITEVSKHISSIKPDTLFIQNGTDIHSDHRVVFETSISCTKSFRYPFIKNVYLYEALSETEFAPPLVSNFFMPNTYSDITNYIDKKIEIMNIYESEMLKSPFPRSEEVIRAQATYRGTLINVASAEAFMCLRTSID